MPLAMIGAWLALSLLLGIMPRLPAGTKRWRWAAVLAVMVVLAGSLAFAWGGHAEPFPRWRGALVFDGLSHVLLPPLWTGVAGAMLVCLFLPTARYELALAGLSTAVATAGILSANPLLTVALIEASALLILAGLIVHAERPGGNILLSIATGIKFVTVTLIATACLLVALLLANFYALNQDRIELPRIIVALLVIGFGLVVGAMPFYFHIPDVFDAAPAMTTASMVGPLQCLAVVYLMRTAGNDPWLLADGHVIHVLTYGALLGSVVAAVMAFGQRTLNRLLAFTAIRELGWLAFGIATVTRAGWEGALIFLAARCVAQPLLVAAVAAIEASSGEIAFAKLGGLPRLMPVAALGWAVGAMASVGLPPAASFWALAGLVRSSMVYGWPALVLLLASALLGLWRFAQTSAASLWRTPVLSRQTWSVEAPGAAWVIGCLAMGLLFAGIVPRLFAAPVNDVLSSLVFLR